MLVRLDGKPVFDLFDGFLLRRAPGCCHYDFVQEISFINPPTSQTILPNQHGLRIAVSSEGNCNKLMLIVSIGHKKSFFKSKHCKLKCYFQILRMMI